MTRRIFLAKDGAENVAKGANAPKNLCVLGATGSIGDSVLQIARLHRDAYRVFALSAFGRVDKLFDLCVEFAPKYAVLGDDRADADAFAERLKRAGLEAQVLQGQAGLRQIAALEAVDTVVAAIVGAAGLDSVFAAVKAGKTVLLANKEALVMAGALLTKSAKRYGARLLPIDSEHNAIFQCLPPQAQADSAAVHNAALGIKKLYLTASGGSFLRKSFAQMQNASVEEAVRHPNWSMGKKISVDSSTMMNKGLELIEARYLFDVDADRIEVLIHPQSVVHSMVAYSDGSVLAQMASPDMRTPIAHALAYPERAESGAPSLDFLASPPLEFLPPDTQKFACLALARHAVKTGAGACVVLNAANEVAVAAFLNGQMRLTDIAVLVERCLGDAALASDVGKNFDEVDDADKNAFDRNVDRALAAIFALDDKARNVARAHLQALALTGKD